MRSLILVSFLIFLTSCQDSYNAPICKTPKSFQGFTGSYRDLDGKIVNVKEINPGIYEMAPNGFAPVTLTTCQANSKWIFEFLPDAKEPFLTNISVQWGEVKTGPVPGMEGEQKYRELLWKTTRFNREKLKQSGIPYVLSTNKESAKIDNRQASQNIGDFLEDGEETPNVPQTAKVFLYNIL